MKLKSSFKSLGFVLTEKELLIQQELSLNGPLEVIETYPINYIDRSNVVKISDIYSLKEKYTIRGTLSEIKSQKTKRGSMLSAVFSDDSGRVELAWVRGVDYFKKILKEGKKYTLFGSPSMYGNRIKFYHPELKTFLPEAGKRTNNIQPVYPKTESLRKRNISDAIISTFVEKNIKIVQPEILELFSEEDQEKYRLIPRFEAIKTIHFPSSFEKLEQAKFYLKFEEFFLNQLRIIARTQRKQEKKGEGHVLNNTSENYSKPFITSLSFNLTDGQKSAIKDVFLDFSVGKQMNRLLQGDVGSGKTVVALITLLKAIDNGYQTAFIAPTTILAQQHFVSITSSLFQLGLNISLLTGKTKKREREEIMSRTRIGDIDLLIGTHAILEDTVKFKNLGYVVIDEQHRFGVLQRYKMWKKNNPPPHILVMTATPIPRTMSMTVYGDLHTSSIKEMPKGRKKIKTYHRYQNNRGDVYQFIEQQIQEGRQAYIVYPLIEESDFFDYEDLMSGHEEVKRYFLPKGVNICLVHGRQTQEERNIEMQKFIKNEAQIMVCTTVIEVGVDIPNASVMVIENAEKFGLSQLHQLRGRIGRGEYESYCILLSGRKLGKNAKQRLKTMVLHVDGFLISEIDMQLRGPGDIEGVRQSGIMNFKIADVLNDESILQQSRELAKQIINLSSEEKRKTYANLIQWMKEVDSNKLTLAEIS